MIKNFVLTKAMIEIQGDGYVYDLHNCYDYKGLSLNSSQEGKLQIFLHKTKGDWVKREDPNNLSIIFQGLKHFEVSKGFFINPCETIENLGYKNPDDYDYNWLMTEEHFNEQVHIIIGFENDEYIRLFSDRVLLVNGI